MSIEALKWAFEQETVKPCPRFVLVALANRADEEGFCFPSIKWLRKKTGFSDSSIRAYIDELHALGKLSKTETRRDDGGRSSNQYRLSLTQPGLVLTPPPQDGGGVPQDGDTPRRDTAVPPAAARRAPPPQGGGHIDEEKETKRKRRKEGAVLFPDLPDFIPRDEWTAYEADRVERRKKLTTRARKMAWESLAKLHASGHDLKAIIGRAIERGWSSFHPLTDTSSGGPATLQERNRAAADEAVRRLSARTDIE